jgi:hypothetical protein
MKGGSNMMEETPESQRKRRRVRRGFLVGCGAIVVFLVVSPIAIYLRSQARYTVIGPTDPVTGIRIEYTVSPRYIRKPDDKDNSTRGNHDTFADWQYTPSSSLPSPFMQWLRVNILKHLDATMSETEGQSTITQTSSKHAELAGWFVDPQGFVRVDLKRASGMVMAVVASQEPKMVGDCPTTLVVEDRDIVVSGHPLQSYDLLVRPPGQTVIYVFEASGIEGKSPNPDLRELKAIRDSIRVVKAK